MSVRVASPGQPFGRTGYSVDQFLEIAERSRIFDGVIASTVSDVLWMEGNEPHRLRGNHGTANTFDVMGVPALVGRTFSPADVEGSASLTRLSGRPGSCPVPQYLDPAPRGIAVVRRQAAGYDDMAEARGYLTTCRCIAMTSRTSEKK